MFANMENDSNEFSKFNGSDTSDALGFSLLIHPIVNLIGTIFTSGSSSNKKKEVVKTLVEKDAYFYNMKHQKRGLALIFNHGSFIVPHLKERNGTEVDCRNLENCLRKLDFEVNTYNDLGVKKILDTVDKVASSDHSNNDCFALFILTHGEQGVLFAHDGAYKHDHIFDNFRGDKCPSLAGKPKLFFIQACQGSRLDSGVTLSTQVDSSSVSYKLPVYADFLVVYSTIPGFYSWRNTTNGSWFIQALVAELKENCYNFDLLTILTFVCRRVAVDFESNVPGDQTMHSQKQIPCITSMLTRLIKFSPKDENLSKSIKINTLNSEKTFYFKD